MTREIVSEWFADRKSIESMAKQLFAQDAKAPRAIGPVAGFLCSTSGFGLYFQAEKCRLAWLNAVI